ncbi:hypothetical protein I6I98_08825 [Sphingobacterium multivorum]|uniref:Uncharacterized protein n=1 Tax=Sphingobacterium multivorum TaxID=28454 RepID=A0ABX7CX18_SPHMU|nr:hypothetical protein [Sphingobacterium multivorum]QQT55341.1 hypothetical protein I6I98_08825 [Sphingobacterium multivorum]
MRDFSIDIATESIYSPKTKEYFEEVVKSYYNGSYRSAVVMLYSIAITDLIFKLEELRDLYDDQNAIDILNEISTMQDVNPNSPDWENKIIKLVKEKTQLLEAADHLNLNTLQKHRHLCAHPIITQNSELYQPNKETTRSHIRNTLEGLLIKAPLLSRKILEDLLEHLSSIKSLFNDNNKLEQHLKDKYLNKLNAKISFQIFKSLWKIVFKVSNPLSDKNRDINFKTLCIIFKTYYSDLLKQIQSEKDFYSQCDNNLISYYFRILNTFPLLWNSLNQSITLYIEGLVKKDADLDCQALFLSKNIETHIKKILAINWQSTYEKSYISTQSIIEVYNYALNENKNETANMFLIKMFGKSSDYDQADTRFESLIEPYLSTFSEDQIKTIINEIDKNSQIHDRRKAKESNFIIKRRALEINNKFDFKEYIHFRTT